MASDFGRQFAELLRVCGFHDLVEMCFMGMERASEVIPQGATALVLAEERMALLVLHSAVARLDAVLSAILHPPPAHHPILDLSYPRQADGQMLQPAEGYRAWWPQLMKNTRQREEMPFTTSESPLSFPPHPTIHEELLAYGKSIQCQQRSSVPLEHPPPPWREWERGKSPPRRRISTPAFGEDPKNTEPLAPFHKALSREDELRIAEEMMQQRRQHTPGPVVTMPLKSQSERRRVLMKEINGLTATLATCSMAQFQRL